MMSGLAGSMMSGMASGVGFSMANRAMDAVMGPRQTEVVHRHEGGAPPAPGQQPMGGQNLPHCQTYVDQLNQCMAQASEASQCQFYMDTLKQCNAEQL